MTKKTRKPKPPKGPRNLKKHGFTNALWRLEERDAARKAKKPSKASVKRAAKLRAFVLNPASVWS
jgi:hypothetical protein